jgi:putative intracellular protease/amidase
MKIAVLLYPGVTALDAIGPYEVLSRLPGARVHFVAKERGPIVTDTGMLALLPELALAEVGEADVLVVPGALEGFRAVMADEETLAWIRRIDATTQWTTSVCTGALILGAAGLLNGLEATTHWAAMPALPPAGGHPFAAAGGAAGQGGYGCWRLCGHRHGPDPGR